MTSANPTPPGPVRRQLWPTLRQWTGRRLFWDVVLLLVVFSGGATIGSRYVATFQQHAVPAFGQPEFAAAVSVACGRGFVNPLTPPAALRDFLNQRTDVFSCDQLPRDIALGPLNLTQGLYRYLMIAVAWHWKWSGISWSGLTPLFGAAFGLTLCAAYGLFRLAGGPLVGLLGVVPLAASAQHLGQLPSLRDYAKAPFMLLLMIVIARLGMPPYSRRRTLLLAGVFGLFLGVGFGFRNDLLINVPPFVAAVFLLLPVRWRDELRVKGMALAVASLVFVLSAWPILRAYQAGNNNGHVAVLGLTSTFDEPLGVTRPTYDLGSHYADGYAATVINAHSRLRSGRVVDYMSPEYDSAAFSLLAAVARHWPADIITRSIAAVLQVLEAPFAPGRHAPAVPPGVTAPAILQFYETQRDLLSDLSGLGVFCTIAAAVLIGAAAPRAGVAVVLLALYYCGYPAVQFHSRHFFHLEWIPWWAMVFIAATASKAVWQLVVRRRIPERAIARAARGLVTIAAMGASLVLLLWIGRVYQQHHLETLFDTYLKANRTALAVSRTTAAGRTLVTPMGLWSQTSASEPVDVRYLEAEFVAADCGAVDLPVTAVYEAKTADNDFSFVTRVPLAARGPTRLLIPGYYNGQWSHFVGFSLPTGYDGCLTAVRLIDDLRRIPVLVSATFPPDWRDDGLFQRLAGWEGESIGAAPVVRTQPIDLIAPVASRVSRVTPLQAEALAPGMEPSRTWAGTVGIDTPHQWLVRFPVLPIEEGLELRVTGMLYRGGLAVGISAKDEFVDSRSITAPGPFTVLIRPPYPGGFGVLVRDFSALPWWRPKASLLQFALRLVPPRKVDVFELHDVAWIRSAP